MTLNMLFSLIKLMDIGVNGVNLVSAALPADRAHKPVKGHVRTQRLLTMVYTVPEMITK